MHLRDWLSHNTPEGEMLTMDKTELLIRCSVYLSRVIGTDNILHSVDESEPKLYIPSKDICIGFIYHGIHVDFWSGLLKDTYRDIYTPPIVGKNLLTTPYDNIFKEIAENGIEKSRELIDDFIKKIRTSDGDLNINRIKKTYPYMVDCLQSFGKFYCPADFMEQEIAHEVYFKFNSVIDFLEFNSEIIKHFYKTMGQDAIAHTINYLEKAYGLEEIERGAVDFRNPFHILDFLIKDISKDGNSELVNEYVRQMFMYYRQLIENGTDLILIDSKLDNVSEFIAATLVNKEWDKVSSLLEIIISEVPKLFSINRMETYICIIDMLLSPAMVLPPEYTYIKERLLNSIFGDDDSFEQFLNDFSLLVVNYEPIAIDVFTYMYKLLKQCWSKDKVSKLAQLILSDPNLSLGELALMQFIMEIEDSGSILQAFKNIDRYFDCSAFYIDNVFVYLKTLLLDNTEIFINPRFALEVDSLIDYLLERLDLTQEEIAELMESLAKFYDYLKDYDSLYIILKSKYIEPFMIDLILRNMFEVEGILK